MWIQIEHPKKVFSVTPLARWLADWMNENNITAQPVILNFDGRNLEAVVWVDDRPKTNILGDE